MDLWLVRIVTSGISNCSDKGKRRRAAHEPPSAHELARLLHCREITLLKVIKTLRDTTNSSLQPHHSILTQTPRALTSLELGASPGPPEKGPRSPARPLQLRGSPSGELGGPPGQAAKVCGSDFPQNQVMLGLYGDNGQENGNYDIGVIWGLNF